MTSSVSEPTVLAREMRSPIVDERRWAGPLRWACICTAKVVESGKPMGKIYVYVIYDASDLALPTSLAVNAETRVDSGGHEKDGEGKVRAECKITWRITT